MNQILNKLKQYPVGVIGVLALVLCVGIAFLRGSVVAELSAKETELIARIRTINDNVKNSKNLEQDVESLVGYVDSIDERLFIRDARSINTNFFYSLEDRLDILISDVNQLTVEDPALIKGGPNELTLYSGIVYEITAKGSFEEMIKFMYEIQRMDSLMRIANFQVSAVTNQGAKSGELLAKFRVVVLAEKE